MILKRKSTAPIVLDVFGIEHPELCILPFSVLEDKKLRTLEIGCGYYHAPNSPRPLMIREMDIAPFAFRFKENTADMPTYTQVMNDIKIEDNGDITILNTGVVDWILNQRFVLDFEGKVFADNWEMQ